MYKILLCCSSGITTNMLVNSMKEAAKKENRKVLIWSVAETALDLSWSDADCVLVAPQKKELINQVEGAINNTIPVEVIAEQAFINMDGEAVLNHAIKLIDKV